MKVFLRTWRYGVEATLAYHGDSAIHDAVNSVLEIRRPVLDYGIGIATSVTITSGDEFTVVYCDGCPEHPEETILPETTSLPPAKYFQI